MNKILLPTDFSELGTYAYNLAHLIAKKTNADITALSVVPGPQGALYSSDGQIMNDEGNDYSEWHNRLENNKKKMQEWVSDKGDITDNQCIIGDIDQSILQYSESLGVDLIIMGTEGLFTKSMWSKGSHTEYISNHTDIPVLSLKCDRSNLDLSQMVLAGDFLENEKVNLSVLKDIQAAFDSKIILLKIKTPSKVRSDEKIQEDMAAFAVANDLKNYETRIYNDTMVETGIGKFCGENNIDIIALGTHQGKGFSKLFRRSISDDIVNHLYHPILTFPLK